MIKDILKMGGCKTEAEFYAKYPTEESFLEAFPQARPMMERFSQGGDVEAFPQTRPMLAKGGALDIEAFPTAAPNVNDYGGKTRNHPFLFQVGGMVPNMDPMGQSYPAGQDEDPLVTVVAMVSKQYNIDPQQVIQLIKGLPKDLIENLYVMAANDPQQASERVAQFVNMKSQDPISMGMKKGGSLSTPPTAEEFFRQYTDVTIPIPIVQTGGPTPMLNTNSEISTGGSFDEYGGSVFNYGQFPAIMKDGGTIPMNQQNTYVPDRIKTFLEKITAYANAHKEKQMEEAMINQQAMMRRGGASGLPTHQFPPGETGGFIDFGGYGQSMQNVVNDAAMVQGEMAMKNQMGQPMQSGQLTDYEINKFSDITGKDSFAFSNPNPGEIGPPKPDYVSNKELGEEQTANMPGSTANEHYDDQGNYTLGQGSNQEQPSPGKPNNNDGKKKKDNWWKRMTGVEKAETILAVGNRLLEPFEKKRMKKREEQLDEALFNPMNWGSSMQADKGDWDQFGKLRRNTTPVQFAGNMAAYGGQLPVAQSGLEVKMRAGLGFNANQLSWPVMAGEFSQPDMEVRSTLGPTDLDNANLEAELGETAVSNLTGDGIPEQYKIGGKRHYDGGTPLNLPENSFVFSRDKSMKVKDSEILAQFGVTSKPKGGMTPADIAKRYDLNKYKKALLDPNSDQLTRDTAEANIKNGVHKLGMLAMYQESMKAFPDGIPMISMPYLESVGVTPDMLPVNPMQGSLDNAEQPAADNMARYGSNVIAQMQMKRYGGLPKHQTTGQTGEWVFTSNSDKSKPATATKQKPVANASDLLWNSGQPVDWYDLNDTRFTDPDDAYSNIGYPFLAMMNYNVVPDIMQRKTYYNPSTDKIQDADIRYRIGDKIVDKDGKIDKHEWEMITKHMRDFQEKLGKTPIPKEDKGYYLEDFASMFTPNVGGWSAGAKIDDMLDIMGTKMENFGYSWNLELDVDDNKQKLSDAEKQRSTYQKKIEELKKKPASQRGYDYAYNMFEAQVSLDQLDKYIEKAKWSIDAKTNMFYFDPIENKSLPKYGKDDIKIPTWSEVYKKEVAAQLKNAPPASPIMDDSDVEIVPPPAVDNGVPPAAAPAAVAPKQPAQRPKQQTVNPEDKARQQIGPDWDTWSQEDKDQYLKLKLRDGGSPLPKHQTKGPFTLDYKDIPGYNVAGPDWRLNLPSIGEQAPSKGDYYTTSSGIIWPKSRKDVEPNVDWFRTYPGASDAIWQQYDKDKGFEKWKEDLAKAKGQQSPASEFWVKNIVNPYTSGIPGGEAYIDKDVTGAYIPGTEWSTPPVYTKIEDKPKVTPVVEETPKRNPDIPGPVPPGKGITPLIRNRRAPFWTQDVINTGAAFGNLARIKKYTPWQAKAPFYPAQPTLESPERALAANFENLAQGVEGLSNLQDPSSFVSSFSAMSGKAGANAANIIADVHNRNIDRVMSVEMKNKADYNQYMMNQAQNATNLYDKWTIANQQYDNARNMARNELRKSVVNAWTNRGLAATLNNMYADQFVLDPKSSIAGFYKGRDFRFDQPKVSDMPDNIKTVYDKLLGQNTPESLKAAGDLYINWLKSQRYGKDVTGKKKQSTSSADQALLNAYGVMGKNWQ